MHFTDYNLASIPSSIIPAKLLAFLTILERTLISTGWAYDFGHPAMAGTVHDVAVHAMPGLTVAGLLCLLPILILHLAPAVPSGQVNG